MLDIAGPFEAIPNTPATVRLAVDRSEGGPFVGEPYLQFDELAARWQWPALDATAEDDRLAVQDVRPAHI
jgi:hypothetical protein